MKSKRITMAMIMAVGALGAVSHAQVQVGAEDFESYPIGAWNIIGAPDANPQLYVNGTDNGNSVTIVDEGGTNQNLLMHMNLKDCWQIGYSWNIAQSNNVSFDAGDYSLDFYWHMTAETASNLLMTAGGFTNQSRYFVLSIRDVDNSAVGSQYTLVDYDPGFTNALAGSVLTIPLGSGSLASGCNVPLNTSATNWQFQFRIDGSSWATNEVFDITIDDIVVNYDPPPFVNIEWSPTWITVTNPTVSGTLYDGTSEVNDMLLYVDDALVASGNYAGGSVSNTISYDWNDATFGYHTGKVVAVDASLYSETNSWVFFVPTTTVPAATNAIDVYSINFAGGILLNGDATTNTYYFHPVANGLVAAAPSIGSNIWFNLRYDNPWWFTWQDKTIPPASGNGNHPSMGYMMVNESPNFNIMVDWGWMAGWHSRPPFYAAANNTIWAFSAGNTPFNAMFDFSGLPTDRTYDMYLYFTNPDTTDPQTTRYTIMQDYGISAYPGAILVSDQTPLSGGYTNYVEGTNYMVITGITPNSGGTIRLRAEGDNGGISAIQVVVRDDGQGAGSVIPTIQSYALTSTTNGPMNDLTWDSESFVSYTVMKKSALTDPTWTMVTNVYSSIYYPVATSISLPASGNQEFFKIEGN